MTKEPIYLAFSTQKGGAGKTTLTVLVASLVRVLVENGGEVTVGGYIDKIIHEHLQTYKDEINELYRNSRPDLLK